MATLLQTALRTSAIILLTVVWSAAGVLRALYEFYLYKRESKLSYVAAARSFFGKKAHNERPTALFDSDKWTHKYIQLKNIRMHYVEAGDAERPLMVLLHGFPEFWYSYRYQLRHFRDNYRVVALDMRGYNETDKPEGIANYEPDLVAIDVAEAIEKLGGKAILIGHDWGGVIAWILAMDRPDLIERLVILNVPHPEAFKQVIRTRSAQLFKSSYMFMFQCPYLPEFLLRLNDYNSLNRIFRGAQMGLRNVENFTDADLEAWKYVFSQPNALTAPLNYYRAAMRHAAMRLAGNRRARGEPVRAPTLIIWGEEDGALEVEGAELSLALCESARLERIPHCSHWVQQDVPEKVNALIEEFIAQ